MSVTFYSSPDAAIKAYLEELPKIGASTFLSCGEGVQATVIIFNTRRNTQSREKFQACNYEELIQLIEDDIEFNEDYDITDLKTDIMYVKKVLPNFKPFGLFKEIGFENKE